jgi:multiple sugar transport system ATP-binding protein
VRRVREERERPCDPAADDLDDGEGEHEHEGAAERAPVARAAVVVPVIVAVHLRGHASAEPPIVATRLPNGSSEGMIAPVAGVAFEGVSKVYPDGTRAVNDLSLEIEDGEFMVLVGPSGCGKTTALRMVAGLEDISEGVVRIGDRPVNHVPSRDRDIAMVFQSYALYPHLTVFENIAFGLRLRKVDKAEVNRRVADAARILGLEAFLDRKPRALSGGQRQRVAMGRAIVREPQAFLMDEPLSNLDAKLRVQMRAEIAELQNDLGVTTIYVTHDQVEAMTMGDRVAVMRKGELQQVASPQELYDRPLNLFVGGFIGSPAMNMVMATVERANGGLAAHMGGQRFDLGPETLEAHPALRAYEGREIVLGIRPEDLEDAALEPDVPASRRIHGRVRLTEALGAEVMVHFEIDAPPAVTDETRELQRDAGVTETSRADEQRATLVGRFGARSRVKIGDTAEIAVDTRALHFFDPETGRGIYAADDQTKGA